MTTLLTVYRGKSLTIGFVFPVSYDLARIEASEVYLDNKLYESTLVSNVLRCEISSNETAVLLGNRKLSLLLDDSILGMYPIVAGIIKFDLAGSSNPNESVNTGFDLLFPLIITETAISVDTPLYNYFVATLPINTLPELTPVVGTENIITEDVDNVKKRLSLTGLKTWFTTAFDLVYLKLTAKITTANVESAVDLKHASGSDNQSASDFDVKDLTDSTGLRSNWSGKQDTSSNLLNTIDKNLVNAINEVNAIAKGADQAESTSTLHTAITLINAFTSGQFNIGQSILIVQIDVPDLWLSSLNLTNVPYTYTTDSAFIAAVIAGGGSLQVGFYNVSFLENNKVDLTEYYTKTEIGTNFLKLDQTTPQTIGATGTRLTKLWAVDGEFTNIPTVGGSAILSSLTTPVFSGGLGIGITPSWGLTSPEKTLHIAYNGDGFPTIVLERLGGSSKTNKKYSHYIGSTGAYVISDTTLNITRIVIAPGGEIGYNDASPIATFQIGQNGTGYGTVTTNGTSALVGVNTRFTNNFKSGDIIGVQGESNRTILTITDDTHLTTTVAFSTATSGLTYTQPSATLVSFKGYGGTGFGVVLPTATAHFKAGSAAAGSAPIKFTSGALNTTAEAGAVEFLTDDYYGTITTNAIRRKFVMDTTGRATAQTAANASVQTYTLGAADASFEVSANVLVTTSSAENFTVRVAYTDEGNTARTLTLPFITLAGVSVAIINFANGAVPYEGIGLHIRVKASTTITVATVGAFTGATYNVESIIKKI